MRDQYRAKKPQTPKKRPPVYCLEPIERRMLLSVSLPSWWMAYPHYQLGAPPEGSGGSATPVGLSPQDIVDQYGANGITFGSVVGNGAGQTIAIVDAYDDPTAAADLATFDAAFELPAPPVFEKLNDRGQPSPLPGIDPAAGSGDDWEIEESLDIEWAHSMAPGANILLFEANDPVDDLYNTVAAAAATPGVSVVSMSWSGSELPNEASTLDPTFTTPVGHQGITFLAAAGDNGPYEPDTTTLTPQYPDTSPNVISVGGTTLESTGTAYGGEIAWGDGVDSGVEGGTGGGISAFEAQPSWQTFLAGDFSTTYRTYPDVAMDADNASGVAVCDSFDNGATDPWFITPTGGTSLATPLFAGLIAIADQGRVIHGFGTLDGPSETLPHLYNLPAADFHDITAGNSGYPAEVGYDLATGRGSAVAPLLVSDLASSYIGSHVFYDGNQSGVVAPGDPGISGVVVTLENSDGAAVASTTTDSQGFYEFVDVTPGTGYFVNFSVPSGYTISQQVLDATAGNENVASPLTGDTPTFTVTALTENYFENAGAYQQTITITSFVSVLRPHSGVAPMVFTVTLSPAPLFPVDVPYATQDGSATVANDDYIPTSGTLVFPAGTSQETITVDAVGNLVIENNVSYYVDITVPGGYVPAPGGTTVGTGLIENDNFPVATVTGPAAQLRSASTTLTYPFTIGLSATAPFEVDVNYSTVDFTAVAGVDYVTASGTLAFPPGTTSEVIDVTVLAGTNRELNKTFQMEITQPLPVTATIGTPSVADGVILTNAPPAISANNAEVTESPVGIAYLPFTVSVSPSLTGTVTVNYATANGTAQAGIDYVAESGTLTFAPGRIVDTVFVPVPEQFIPAQSKTLSLTISDASNDLVILNPVAEGTINYLNLAEVPFYGAAAATPGNPARRTLNAVYTDALGQVVTVSMKGPGTGDILFLGNSSVNTNAYEIVLDGNTTAATSFAVRVARGGQTSITSFVDSGSVGLVDARQLNVVSSFTVVGSANIVNLGLLEDASLIVGGANSGQTVALNLQNVVNSTINSAIPIRTLTTGSYVNTSGSALPITAPSIGNVFSAGNFQGTIETASLQSLAVNGTLDGGVIASSSIGSISAAAIVDSTLFAGIASGLTSLPTTPSQFSNTAASIGSVRVRGVFSDSLLAAATVNNMRAGEVLTTPGGAAFGLSALHFGKIQAVASSTGQLIALNNPVTSTTTDNFTIDVV